LPLTAGSWPGESNWVGHVDSSRSNLPAIVREEQDQDMQETHVKSMIKIAVGRCATRSVASAQDCASSVALETQAHYLTLGSSSLETRPTA
jgi:hypothetical protein